MAPLGPGGQEHKGLFGSCGDSENLGDLENPVRTRKPDSLSPCQLHGDGDCSPSPHLLPWDE